jgi:hypothetical protein
MSEYCRTRCGHTSTGSFPRSRKTRPQRRHYSEGFWVTGLSSARGRVAKKVR